MSDPYKVQQLNRMLEEIRTDEYALARLKSDGSKTINLDEGALKLLIDYYSGKVTASNRKFTKYPYKSIKASTIKPKSSLSNAEYQRVKSQIEQGLPITQNEYDQLSLLEKDYSSAANAEMRKPIQRCDMGYAQFMRDNALEVKKLLETASVGVDASTSVKASLVGRNSDRFEIDVYDPEMYDDIMAVIDERFSSCMGTLFSSFFTIEGPAEDKSDVGYILDGFGAYWEEV